MTNAIGISARQAQEVDELLTKVRAILEGGGNFYLIRREKNLQTLSRLGFTIRNCRDAIMALRLEDYSSGPLPDTDPRFKGDIWTFGLELERIQVYVKIKAVITGTQRSVTCLSFHEAEFPLSRKFGDRRSSK